MYIKLKNGMIEKYPYSLGELVSDNPNTSFPEVITEECAASFEVYPVVLEAYPQVDITKTVIEETPNFINGVWYQDYKVINASEEEILQRKLELNTIAENNRASAYKEESDPLFFKWQRDEATKQEWLDKIEEIKQRYPKVE